MARKWFKRVGVFPRCYSIPDYGPNPLFAYFLGQINRSQ